MNDRSRGDVQGFVPTAAPAIRPSRPITNTVGIERTPYAATVPPDGSSRIGNVMFSFLRHASALAYDSCALMATTRRPRAW